ncbi:hypothetical protein AcV7_003174 [Taiwanofungus camphoratus]|nr:hypothetical protein AcV7_003174 [Antrodia cinnamomea]
MRETTPAVIIIRTPMEVTTTATPTALHTTTVVPVTPNTPLPAVACFVEEGFVRSLLSRHNVTMNKLRVSRLPGGIIFVFTVTTAAADPLAKITLSPVLAPIARTITTAIGTHRVDLAGTTTPIPTGATTIATPMVPHTTTAAVAIHSILLRAVMYLSPMGRTRKYYKSGLQYHD